MMPACKRVVSGAMAMVLACGAMLFAGPPAEAQGRDCGSSVTLQFGDTLSSVARRCGTTVDAIMAANPLIPNPNFIFPGLRIRLPEPTPLPPPPTQNVQRYVVQPGDTLYGIARANNTTLPDIFRLNPDIDARTLRVGDVVLLPGRGIGPRPPQHEPTFRYRVRPGDTLRSIAREHDLRVGEIYRLNPGVDARDLRVGDMLILPGNAVAPPPPATNTVRYIVRPGDTLYSIARANGTTVREILDLNPSIDPRFLRAGDVVVLRGGIVPPPPHAPRTATTVSPSTGAPGDVVEVSASGFPPSTPLKLLAGSDTASLVEFQQVTSDSRGRATLSARVPRWAAAQGTLVFAYETEDGRLRAVSSTFRVTTTPQQPSSMTVVGTLTREGVECQAMRGDDGRLYTLTGDLPRRLRAGDRVRVAGQVAEVSFCQQGTTISVTRISEAN